MKKMFILLLLSLSVAEIVQACDICGCGVGSYYLGILPEFRKRIVGVRYRYNSLRTHIGSDGSSSYLTTNEIYRTAELWGGWTIGRKFRLIGNLPFNFNEKKNQGVSYSRAGIGDISVQAFYELIDKNSMSGSSIVVQSLWLGAGIKLPTGKYDAAEKNSISETNIFQLGTGSTDFSMHAVYDVRIQDFGVNVSAAYKINGTNREHYRYGNKTSANMQAYYKVRVKNKFTVAPNAGMLYESGQKDIDKDLTADLSGGNMLMVTAGAELTFQRVAVGANIQVPAAQDLAGGFVKANTRAMVHVSFML